MRMLKAVLVLLALGTVSAFGQTAGPSQATNETPSQWFVELTGAPQADVDATFTEQQKANYRAARRAERDAWRGAARARGLQYRELQAYDVLWNGLAIEITPSQLSVLGLVPGTKDIYPVFATARPETAPMNEPELVSALAMTGADVTQSELGFTGAGIRVAVMDTGVDFDHPDLGGCFGPACRVQVGFDLVGDAFNFSDTTASIPVNPTPVPDPFPDDCNGHGTHVAGIVGANGTVKGVAPGVTFGAYRVFGCDGNTSTAIMLSAMERILVDGADVLNMSIGSAFQWPQYPTARASDRLVNKGIVVVASIGNNGANGVYAAGAPGLGSKVIGVASYDNTNQNFALFRVSPDGAAIGYANATGAPPAPLSGSLPMSRTGTPTSTADGCSALAPGSLAGTAVLIRRGTCSFRLKTFNAQAAGASAVVLYNNVAGRVSPTVAGTDPPGAVLIPVVAVSDAEGVLINGRIAAGPTTLTWTNESFSAPNPTGGRISTFSSFGLSPDLAIKPDIGAPGGLIRSTYPIEKGSFTTISGTSMSSPHVAGGVALLLQARPKTSAQDVRTILQNSADPNIRVGTPAGLDNVHRQGAGMLDIDDAILSMSTIEPAKLALGESQSGPAVRTLRIKNSAATSVTYALSHQPALGTHGSTFVPAFNNSAATVAFSTASLTLLAKTAGTVNVTITPPATPLGGQYGGYLVISGGGQTFRVPYGGFIGDYQSIQVLQPLAFGFPWLARLVGTTFFNQPAGATYTLASGDVPYVLVHLGHQSRRLRLEVFESGTGKSWHRAFELNYAPRNTANGPNAANNPFFFALPWNGTTMGGNKTYTVPDGQYVIRLTIVKALAEDGNPAHMETWTSPVITIDRP